MIKAAIWDLDDTIFDGVLSEDAAPPVRAGVADLIRKLANHGVISSVASRNDRVIALQALATAGLSEYVVYPQISWGQKSAAVERILTDLHLRSQDVIFIDDRAFERDEVRARFPDILCHDGREIEGLFEEVCAGCPSVIGLHRLLMYKDEERRLTARQHFAGCDKDFLDQCQITVDVREAAPTDLGRVAELLERTNQLNSTKVVLNQGALYDISNDLQQHILIFAVSDRYGNYGVSAAAIFRDTDKETVEVCAFVISCRLMGKGIAQALLAIVYQDAARRGRRRLVCRFIATDYNRQMHLLFAMNGFCRGEDNRGTHYSRLINDCAPKHPQWLRFRSESSSNAEGLADRPSMSGQNSQSLVYVF